MTSADATADTSRPRTPAAVVDASGLPPPLADLVLAVTGRSRLWPSERTDVARELCAHFLDGLASGAAPDDLARAFGDVRAAARLITGAKKRQRPLWWRAARGTALTGAAFLVVAAALYGVLAARFFLVSPNVTRNFMAELNAPVLALPESDRAWPLYVRALEEFGPRPGFMDAGADPRPGDEHWDDMAAWLKEHRHALDTVRQAASLPSHGYIYRSTLDPEYARVLGATRGHSVTPEPERENPMVVGVLLPYLGHLRTFARWLDADARLAIEERDAPRFLTDVEGILGMAEQCFREPMLISTLVGLAIVDLSTRTVLDAAAVPDFLDEQGIRELAHRFAALGGGSIRIDVSHERVTIEDILQRFYSDDGRGDGRFIGAPEQTGAVYDDFGLARPRAYPLLRALQPIQSVMLPSRADIRRMTDDFIARAALDEALPPWRHDERRSDEAWNELMESALDTVFPLLRALAGDGTQGPVASACAARDIVRTRRDALLTVLALELHHRRHGRWPETLTMLVPGLLPAVPLDPFTGAPLRYVPPDAADSSSRPLLYSVGVDETDDGGALPATRAARFGVHNLQWQHAFRSAEPRTAEEQAALDAVRGDWILWPLPPPLPER